MHRIWAFLTGLPVGLLGALAFGSQTGVGLELGALAGGLALALAVTLAGRFASHDDERGAHLASAASAGLAALPAAGAAWLGLAPGAGVAFGVVAAALALLLVRAMRVSGPAGGARSQAVAALAAVGVGAAVALGVAGAVAAWRGRAAPAGDREGFAQYVYDVDAGVPLAPAPGCAPEVASTEGLGAGANPAFGADGVLWYDAAAEDGRRQVHRLDPRTGERRCWSCDEPGNNRRPRPTPDARAIVFETDRHATARAPIDWELHFANVRGRALPSRRLTVDPGPDAFGALDPGGQLLVWSSGAGGTYAVATANLARGHGGLVLSRRRVIVPGGASWVAPLAWAPDARTLVVVRGHPLALQSARAIDLASGRERELSEPGARVAAASFSADGSTVALATTRPAAAASALPGALGFAVARIATLAGLGPRQRGTGLRVGTPWADAIPEVPLGRVGAWGAPAGVALAPDGRALVLAQRRPGGGERLVRVALRCDEATATSPPEGGAR